MPSPPYDAYLFTAELFRAPVDAAMRCAVWRRPTPGGGGWEWERAGTIAESNQTFPLVKFEQRR